MVLQDQLRRARGSIPLSSYALATRCPAMLLLGGERDEEFEWMEAKIEELGDNLSAVTPNP
eukprot:874812-Rhodomonas_salina.1